MAAESKTVSVKPTHPDFRWVALDTKNNNKIIAEGKDPKTVIQKANEMGKIYSLLFVPEEGKFIF